MEKFFIYAIPVIFLILTAGCQKEMSTSPDEVTIRNAVIVTSDPPHAAIYINSKNTGQFTPDTISWVESGDVLITLKLQLFKDSSIVIKIGTADTLRVFMDFRNNLSMRGKLCVSSNPVTASIFLNDSATDRTTPYTFDNLVPGYYKVKYKLRGYWDEEEILPVKSIATTMTDKQLTDTLTWLNYTVERTDLPSNYLTCVAIEKGFIKWIGSLNSGVIRFDDRNWTIYDESNSPVPNDIINQLYVDNDQNVWICTNHGVIKKWGDSWTVYDKQNSGIADNRITSVAHGDGKIYFGTMNGLSLLQDGNWTTYKTENSLLPSDQVNAILYQNTNLFWICTDKGLVEIKNNVWTVFSGKPTGFPSNNLRCAAQDIYYKPWFGFKDPGGTAVFIKGNIWTAYAGIPDVNSVAVDKQNIKWFACFGSGIAKLNGNNWTIYNSSNSGLKSDFIFSVATGKNGNKYLASFGAGLIKYKGY